MSLPTLHTDDEDCLPDGHPLQHEFVNCTGCGELLHAGHNECMQDWLETSGGNFCLPCLAPNLTVKITSNFGESNCWLNDAEGNILVPPGEGRDAA